MRAVAPAVRRLSASAMRVTVSIHGRFTDTDTAFGEDAGDVWPGLRWVVEEPLEVRSFVFRQCR
jgi:hypothetical protein